MKKNGSNLPAPSFIPTVERAGSLGGDKNPTKKMICSEIVNLWAVKCQPHLKQEVLGPLPLECQILGDTQSFRCLGNVGDSPCVSLVVSSDWSHRGKEQTKNCCQMLNPISQSASFHEILSFTFEGSFIHFQGCLCEHEQLQRWRLKACRAFSLKQEQVIQVSRAG